MKKYSLSAIGRDRPGIVAALAGPLFKRGCNIEDSSMTILEGEFAVILIMSVPDEVDPAALRRDMEEAGRRVGLTMDMKELPGRAGVEGGPPSNYIITLHGEDRTGIVYKSAELLAELGVNITDLETKAAHGKGSDGKDLYMMVMEVHVPEEVDEKELGERFEKLSEELGVRIKINPIEDYGEL